MSCIALGDLQRLEAHLRRKFGCAVLAIDVPARSHATVKVRIGHEVIGTVDQVDDDDERSWAVTLVVLAEDLCRLMCPCRP